MTTPHTGASDERAQDKRAPDERAPGVRALVEGAVRVLD
jgi:hypothetical protein